MLRDTPGTIIVPTGDTSRYTDFWVCFDRLVRPPNTLIAIPRGVSVAENFNKALRAMQGEWVQIWGDDHTFPPGLLLALLDQLDAHPEVDVVIPLCSKRRHPFVPPMGVTWWETDQGIMGELPWALVPPPSTGLLEIGQSGLAGAVIRRKVIDAIGDPWFPWATTYDMSRTPPVQIHISEDYYFCHRAREKGFKLFVDLEHPIGHIISPTLVPRWSGTRWVTDIILDGGIVATIAQDFRASP